LTPGPCRGPSSAAKYPTTEVLGLTKPKMTGYFKDYSHVYGKDRDVQELHWVLLLDCTTTDKQILD